jgi:hypothetical protein
MTEKTRWPGLPEVGVIPAAFVLLVRSGLRGRLLAADRIANVDLPHSGGRLEPDGGVGRTCLAWDVVLCRPRRVCDLRFAECF